MHNYYQNSDSCVNSHSGFFHQHMQVI